MGGTPEVKRQQIPNTDVSYVDADGNGWFMACNKVAEGCDYYESKGKPLQPNDPKVRAALEEYKISKVVGNMLFLSFMFESMDKLRNGDPDGRCDAAIALGQGYPEYWLAIPLLTSIANDESGEYDQCTRDAARESIKTIKGSRNK